MRTISVANLSSLALRVRRYMSRTAQLLQLGHCAVLYCTVSHVHQGLLGPGHRMSSQCRGILFFVVVVFCLLSSM